MSLRAKAQLSAITQALRVFEPSGAQLVVAGGCALSLYARPTGSPLRTTDDVDFISAEPSWMKQAKILAELCTNGVLIPDSKLTCRYQIAENGIVIDIISPEGFNVGNVNDLFFKAIKNAKAYNAGKDKPVKAITPAYFMVTKLVALLDRGPDLYSSKDAEDIVALTIEVFDLAEQIVTAGLSKDVANLWSKCFSKFGVGKDYIPDLVDAHLHQDDADLRDHAIETMKAVVFDG